MKKIKLKYLNYKYINKPFLYYSSLTLLFYILMLANVQNISRLIFSAAAVSVCCAVIKSTKSKCCKIIAILFFAFTLILYFCFVNSLTELIAGKCSSNSVIFGAVSAIFNTFGIYDLNNLVYFTSYGGARLINDSIVCGAVNIASALNNSSSSLFLTGRIISLFSISGILITARGSKKVKLLLAVFMFITGIESPCLIYLLLCDLPLYFLFLLLNFAGYFISSVLSVKALFLVSPSIYEILFYSQNKIYIICFGIMFCAVSYYFSRLVKERIM